MSLVLVSASRAAREVGTTTFRFHSLVKAGVLPGPWRGSKYYDLTAIRRVIEGASEPARQEAAPIGA
jgi:hypothetical protein